MGRYQLGEAEVLADELDIGHGDELMTWTFVLVYGSWFVAGLGVIVGSWRYWARIPVWQRS